MRNESICQALSMYAQINLPNTRAIYGNTCHRQLLCLAVLYSMIFFRIKLQC